MSWKRPIELPGVGDYDFDFHPSGYGGPVYFACNVKNCGHFGELDPKYKRMLVVLEGRDVASREQLEQQAYELVQELWWEWAQEYAAEEGLGQVYSAGRCGGWLILDEYTWDRLTQSVEVHTSACAHCTFPLEDHVNGKCLFEATTFKSKESQQEFFDRLVAFKKTIEESAEYAHEDVKHQLECLIDNAWADYKYERKSSRGHHHDTAQAGNDVQSKAVVSG